LTPETEVPREWGAAPTSTFQPSEPIPTLPPELPVSVDACLRPYAIAQSQYARGRYEEATSTLLGLCDGPTAEPAEFSLLARSLANQGRLADALAWCDRWITADKMDSAGHYLRAVVLLEQGDSEQARRSLQRAVYLNPDLVLAHFALGNIARGREKAGEADKHFGNALRLLGRQQSDALIPESDGLTAGRLTEIITSLAELENVP